jgi:hypothetical protein
MCIKVPGWSRVSGTRGKTPGKSGKAQRVQMGFGAICRNGGMYTWESVESMEVLQVIRPGESRVSKHNVIGAGQLGKMSLVDVTGIQWGLSSDSSDIPEDFVLVFIHEPVFLQCSG